MTIIIHPQHPQAIAQKLEKHLDQKLSNLEWLNKCFSKDSTGKERMNLNAFPYAMVRTHHLMCTNITSNYDKIPFTAPEGTLNGKPVYLINIPCGYPSIKKNPELLTYLINLLASQAFQGNPNPMLASKRRIAVVIGINQAKSLDQTKNKEFLDYIHNLTAIDGIANHLLGFFWHPQYVPLKHANERTYPIEKCYKLVKLLFKNKAPLIIKHLESPHLPGKKNPLPRIIPMRNVREHIKTALPTRRFANHFQKKAPNSSIYFMTMDADNLQLKSPEDNKGLLTKADLIILNHSTPSAFSFGYRVHEDEVIIIRIAVMLDMYVRAAMNKIIPYSPYFPEPSSFFCIRREKGQSHFLDDLTFICSKSDNKLENRRLIQNGRAESLLTDDALFIADGATTIETPERMYADTNRNITEMTTQEFKTRSTLSSLRYISQTHATPKEWADNLYAALGLKVGHRTNATTHFMAIFGVFDPISRMIKMDEKFGEDVFDTVMQNYSAPLDTEEKNILLQARGKLQKLGVDTEIIDLVVKAAKESGKAIHTVLEIAAEGNHW